MSTAFKSASSIIRADIQAMRALAVMLVVLTHVNVPMLQGGYVGVSIFFAISGFLITNIILREYQAKGKISLNEFFSRRIRRILPATLLVIITTVIISLSFFRDKLEGVVDDAFWSSIFLGNWHFAAEYDSEAALSPLQHLWSLGVEEQFYLFWPLILIGVLLIGKVIHRKHVIVNILLVSTIISSLAYNMYIYSEDIGLWYYSTFSRAWELSAGALIAVNKESFTKLNEKAVLITRYFSIAAIVGISFVLGSFSSLPPLLILVPVFAAVIMISVGISNSSDSLVKNKVIGYIGEVSFSLYLWHWVLISFWQLQYGQIDSILVGGLIIAASILLAGLSTKYIEMPIRNSEYVQNSPTMINIVGIAAVAATAGGLFLLSLLAF